MYDISFGLVFHLKQKGGSSREAAKATNLPCWSSRLTWAARLAPRVSPSFFIAFVLVFPSSTLKKFASAKMPDSHPFPQILLHQLVALLLLQRSYFVLVILHLVPERCKFQVHCSALPSAYNQSLPFRTILNYTREMPGTYVNSISSSRSCAYRQPSDAFGNAFLSEYDEFLNGNSSSIADPRDSAKISRTMISLQFAKVPPQNSTESKPVFSPFTKCLTSAPKDTTRTGSGTSPKIALRPFMSRAWGMGDQIY
eukprot:284817912_1